MKIMNISIDTIVVRIDDDKDASEVKEEIKFLQVEQGTPIFTDKGVKIATLHEFLQQTEEVQIALVKSLHQFPNS